MHNVFTVPTLCIMRMSTVLRVCLTVASTAGIAEPSFAFVPYCATWPTLNISNGFPVKPELDLLRKHALRLRKLNRISTFRAPSLLHR